MRLIDVDKSEQWLLDGKCSICRKKNYCSKPCRACKYRRELELSGLVAKAVHQVIGGHNEKINGTR